VVAFLHEPSSRQGTTQKVAYTGTAGTIPNGVGAQTYQVRIVCTTGAFVLIGDSPTATTSDMPTFADLPEYFSITPGQKVSAIQSSSGGTLYVAELSWWLKAADARTKYTASPRRLA
jgi:hypothetical protein